MYGYIYQTKCALDGRIYIGQKRGQFKPSYRGSGKHLKLAIKKYGKEEFNVTILESAFNQTHLDELEKKYIAMARDIMPPEAIFNISEGGLKGIILKGKNSPHYGRRVFGSKNPNWRGGVCKLKIICCDCQKEIWRGSLRCKSCVGKLRDKNKFVEMSSKRTSPWNKGLTKENNPIIAKMAKAKEGNIPWNKK